MQCFLSAALAASVWDIVGISSAFCIEHLRPTAREQRRHLKEGEAFEWHSGGLQEVFEGREGLDAAGEEGS